MKGFGWYERDKNPDGALLPQQITEFTNSGVVCGLATVNMSQRSRTRTFVGLLGRAARPTARSRT